LNTIRTTRCTLEPLVAAHAPEMFRVLSDPAIYEFENEPPKSEEWLTRRYELLESRVSPDGAEKWLNWVVRLPTGPLAGYVQATVHGSGTAQVAYELNSSYWRQGIGSSAVAAMLEELRTNESAHTFVAVLKTANFRSMAFLRRLGFSPASQSLAAQVDPEPDESVMIMSASARIVPFVPADFAVPEKLETGEFRLRMLTIHDVVKDYDAVMSSIDHCKTIWPGGKWPEGLTLEQNLIDLGWHQKEFQTRRSFAYTVVSLDETKVLGCVYIEPTRRRGYDAEVYLWARQSELAGGLEDRLHAAVKRWIAAAWPFKMAAFPGRDISWENWRAIPNETR
jgi:RimJ/RimL family protein N-acetyltransferase